MVNESNLLDGVNMLSMSVTISSSSLLSAMESSFFIRFRAVSNIFLSPKESSFHILRL